VFVRSLTWHYIRKSLKFRPDGEPSRVISLSPALQPLSFHFFFVVLCVFPYFYVCFSRALVLFAIYLHPRYVSLPFYCFFLGLSFFEFKLLIFFIDWDEILHFF